MRIKDNAPQDKRAFWPAFGLSCAVHLALFAGLFSVFQWQTEPETVYAELWAPEAVSAGQDPNGVAQKQPEPVEEPTPKADEPEQDEAQARALEQAQQQAEQQRREALERAQLEREQALKLAEKARQEQQAQREKQARLAAERAEAERIEKARQDAIEAEKRAQQVREREKAERLAKEKLDRERRAAEEERQAQLAQKAEAERKEKARQLAEKQRIEKEKRIAAAKKAEQERLRRERIRQAVRQQELARLNAKLDPDGNHSGTPGGDKNNRRQNLTGAAKARYNARVIACVRPNITIEVPSSTRRRQFIAEYQVNLLPNGERIGDPKQLKSSGWAAYDRAVENAIIKCQPFPKPEPGFNVPRAIHLTFDPVDDRK